jgi:putative phosphoribosyl transferase
VDPSVEYGPFAESLTIQAGDVELAADIMLSAASRGIVVFAHGSGSGRTSPRNRYVAERLHDAKLGTLLVDLLTPEEQTVDADSAELRFDIPMLSKRLAAVVRWSAMWQKSVGLFGASTGAAAALNAAAELPDLVRAVVSRGGRPDLALLSLTRVVSPTLLIVGGRDPAVLDLNRTAYDALKTPAKALEVVPGAGHLFAEPGALEEVGRLATTWFERHLAIHT